MRRVLKRGKLGGEESEMFGNRTDSQQYGMRGGVFTVATTEGTDSKGAKGVLGPNAGVAFDVDGDAEHAKELTQTTSPLVAWYLCHFLGCRVVRRTYRPKQSLFGRVSYKTHWWLRY
ncbi:MAG: hypothetical protein R6V12_14015 [Candidatus Hydrogenedentota bacterium]